MKKQTVLIVVSLLLICGCSPTVRRSGQTELFRVDPNQDFKVVRTATASEVVGYKRKAALPTWGDFIRYPQDVVTIQVLSAHLENVPVTITGSTDAVLIVDVWENAAAGTIEPNITSIVKVERNHLVPSRFNFKGNLAYGPTRFKGHPLKMRFTFLIVQKERSKEGADTIGVVAKYADMIPTYGVLATPVANVIRDMLMAAPDVIGFEYEVTFLSDAPTELVEPIGSKGESTFQTAALVEMVGKPQAIDRGKGKATSSMYSQLATQVPYLQYGKYVIAETIPLPKYSYMTDDEGRSQVILKSQNFCDMNATCVEDEIIETIDGNNTRRLPTNYIVFSITPGQLAQGNDVLISASQSSKELLTKISKTSQDLTLLHDQIITHQKELQAAVLKSKASALASNIAQQAKSEVEFNRLFAVAWQKETTGTDFDRNEASKIKEAEMAEWQRLYREAAVLEPTVAGSNLSRATDSFNKMEKYASIKSIADSVTEELKVNDLEANCTCNDKKTAVVNKGEDSGKECAAIAEAKQAIVLNLQGKLDLALQYITTEQNEITKIKNEQAAIIKGKSTTADLTKISGYDEIEALVKEAKEIDKIEKKAQEENDSVVKYKDAVATSLNSISQLLNKFKKPCVQP